VAQSAPAWDDLPTTSGDEPSSDATSGSQQSAAPDWDDLPTTSKAAPPAWDDLPTTSKPQAEGPLKSFVRHAANAIVPGVSALAGAGAGEEIGTAAGAALGSMVAPGPGTAVGGAVGGFVGAGAGALVNAYLAKRAQDKTKEALGLDDSTQMALDAKANPKSSGAGDIAGSMVGMNPLTPASLVQRGAAGLVGAGMEAGQQAAGKGDWDPAQIAMSAGAFALAPNTNRLGEAAVGMGQRAAGKFVPGRPGVAAPAGDPARASEDDTSPATLNTERSNNLYGKAKNLVTGAKNMLTKGDVPPDVGAALAGENDEGVEAASTGNPLVRSAPNVPRPVEGNPGEQLPIDTGIQKAAAAQPAAQPPADMSGMQQAPVTAAVTKPEPAPAMESEAPVATGIEAAAAVNKAKPVLTLSDRLNTKATDAAETPSEPQQDADNYAKAHDRFLGRPLSIETPAGNIRRSRADAPTPWEVKSPYHYGDLPGTKGADGDPLDVAVDPQGGENKYVIDQKDADTGKFDEHKIFVSSSPERATDLYNQGFSDGRGPERLGAITPVPDAKLKAWINKPAKKTKPFSKDFEEGVQQPMAPQEGEGTLADQNAPSDTNVTEKSQSIQSDDDLRQQWAATNRERMNDVGRASSKVGGKIASRLKSIEMELLNRGVKATDFAPNEAAPAEAEAPPDVMAKLKALEEANAEPEPRPAIVDKVIKQMRDAGYEKAARVFERLPVEEQIEKAPTVYRIATTGEAPAKPLETARLPGNRDALKVKMGDITVEAKNKTEAATKQAAFDGLKVAFDKHVPPEGLETADATRARAAAYYKDAAQHMPKLRVSDKPREYALAKYARDLVNKKIGPAKFVAEEGLLRDPDQTKGPEIAKQTNRIEADSAKRRGPTAEQAMETHAQPDLEETPDSAEVKNVTSAEDLPAAKPDYDMSKPADRKKIAATLADAGEKPKGDNGGPKDNETVGERIARQRAARLAAQAVGDKPLPAKNEYGKDVEAAKARDAADRTGLQKAVKKKGVVKDLYDHFMAGEPTPKGLGADATAPDPWKKEVPAFSFARDAEPGAETVGRYVNKRLAQVGKDSTNTKYEIMNWAKDLPAAMQDPKAQERAYYAWERDNLASLPPEEEAAFNRSVKPMFEKNNALFDAIQKRFPGVLGVKAKTSTFLHRITKGSTADYNILKEGDDPVAGSKLDLSALNTRAKSTGLDRPFMAMESDADGKRFVIHVNKDGYTVFDDGKATRIKDPNFKFEEGKKYKIGNDSYTMKQAYSDEIEDNARFENGMRVKYYHNAVFSAGVAHQELSDLWNGLLETERTKEELRANGLAVPNGHSSGWLDSWRTSKLPNFDGWKMHPQIADVLDDFAKPGLNDSALDVVRRVNTALAKTLFWNPVPHMLNELTHAFVGRGYRWLMPQNYATLAKTSSKALMSVIRQDELQADLARNHASLIYRPLAMHDFVGNFAKSLGEEVERNPSKWDPIAKKFGVGPSDLVKAIYKNSSKILWAAHDVMITQGVLEREAEGMSRADAVVDLERHMPNYTIPAQVMGGANGGRTISKLMREKSLFMFGNYHYGVWNGYANIYKDLVHGNMRAKAEAAGNIVALAALSGIYYEMDKVSRYLTGNPDASQQRRGPLAVPSHVAAALRGEEDPTSFARSTFTLAPLTTAVGQLLAGGKDYNGKAIVDPGTLSRAAKGHPAAAARAVGQAGDWVARSSISPYSTASNAWHKGEGPGAAMRDQLTDEKNPSAASRKWLHQLPKKNAQSERSREKHPAGLIEKGINKLVGH